MGRGSATTLGALIFFLVSSPLLWGAAPPSCPLVATGAAETVAIAQVDSRLGLTLADGRQVQLAGLEPLPKALAADLHTRLQTALGGQVVQLVMVGPPDRWNRWPAYVYGVDPAPGLVALTLLRQGLARVAPTKLARGCMPAMLGAEAEGRASGLGLWQDPDYAVLHAQDVADVRAHAGQNVIVEGVVSGLRESGARLYLNLGPRRGVDVAAVVLKRNQRALEQASAVSGAPWSLASLVGKSIRVRGLLDLAFGPQIEIADAFQIEVLTPIVPLEPTPGAPR